MRMTYSISLFNYFHYANQPSLERVIADVRHEGYGIELWGSCWNEPDLYDEAGRTRLRPALEGMTVSLHTAVCHAAFAQHQKQIDAAACLNAGVIVLHPEDFLPRGETTPDWDVAQRAVDYAGEHGVKLALENGTYDFLVEAFARVDGLYCCIDVGHIYLNQGTMRQYLDAFKSRLIHVHLQNLCPPAQRQIRGAWADHYTPGPEGIPLDDWQLLWATLEDIDFQGIGVFEIHPAHPLEIVYQAKGYLQQLTSSVSCL